MGRIRRNFLSGTITDDPLLVGGATMNSANLANLPVIVSPDVMALTLDPLGTAGTPEIVYVTAHTAAATSATIIRGQETAVGGYAARQHASGTTWAHIETVMDMIVHQGAEPSSPVLDQLWLDTDEGSGVGLSSILAYAEVTANQGSITTEVDVVGLSVNVTVPAGRRLRISALVQVDSTTGTDVGGLHIKEGTTQLQRVWQTLNTAALGGQTLFGAVVISPTAGAHTYKVAVQRISGGGTLTVGAGATAPNFILVEDITGTLWPVGSTVPATQISDWLTTYNPPACRVYNNASIIVSDATWTALTFNSERYDTASMHSTSSNTSRIVAPVAGMYLITGHIAWGNNAVGERLISIRHNNTTDIANVSLFGTAGSTSSLMKTISTVWKMAANDYVELRVYQNAGGPLTILYSNAFSPDFSATWLGVG